VRGETAAGPGEETKGKLEMEEKGDEGKRSQQRGKKKAHGSFVWGVGLHKKGNKSRRGRGGETQKGPCVGRRRKTRTGG